VHGDYLRTLDEGGEDPFMAELFEDSIPRGGAVVDGGSYLGYHTLVAARRVGPRGKVLSFEPNPVTYRALRRNVRENGYEDRVVALPLGVAAWSGRRTFYVGADAGRRTLELSPRVRLFVECNPSSLENADTTAGAVLDELLDLGFEVQVIDEGRRALERAGPWLSQIAERVYLRCERSRTGRRFSELRRAGGLGSRAR
jgi:FkbM family methyltransferase